MRWIIIRPALFLCLYLVVSVANAQPGSPNTGFGGGTGKVITSFNPGDDIVTSMAVEPDGKIIEVGYTTAAKINVAIIRYNTDGTPDNGFGTAGKIVIDTFSTGSDAALGVTALSNGKILITGVIDFLGAGYDGYVLKLNSDGTPDLSFATNGVARIGTPCFPSSIQEQPGGKIVIGGVAPGSSTDDYFLARLNETSGTLDGSFGSSGIVTTSAAFGTDDVMFGMAFQTDGKILLTGYSKSGSSDNDFVVIRFNGTNGSLDGSFGSGGKVVTDVGTNTDDHAYGIAVDGNGDILVAGYTENADRDIAVLKYSGINGSLVTSFGVNGKLIQNVSGSDEGKGVAVQNDGKFVLAFTSGGNFKAARYNVSDGSTDATFGSSGIANISISVNAEELLLIKLFHDNIYIAGTRSVVGVDDFGLAALLNDAFPLPLNILSFAAQKNNNQIFLDWKTEKETGITQFVVERSSDGRTFSPIGYLPPAKNSQLVHTYHFVDPQPLPSLNFYRLAIKEVDENTIYSKVVAIKFNKQATKELEVFPNPVVNNLLRMQLPDGLNGNVQIQVLDVTGRVVNKLNVQANGGSSIATSLDVSKLQKGVYILYLQGSDASFTKRFVKN